MSEKKKTENGNNFRLEGMILNWVFGEGSCNFDSSAEISFYLYIMRMNIGYGQVESKRLSYNDIKDACKTKSRATISKVLKSLKEKDLIKKVESNSCDKEFKQAYKYRLVFKNELNFPNLGKFWLKDKEEEQIEEQKAVDRI